MKKRKLIKIRFRLTKIKKFRFCTFECKQRRKRAIAAAMSVGILMQGLAQIKQIRSTKVATREKKIRKALAIAETVININRTVYNTINRIIRG